MAVLEIVTYPNEILTTPAKPVEQVDSKIARFMDAMAETMYVCEGVGLAAPQVGMGRQILTMDVGDGESGGPGLIHLANPEIIEGDGEVIWDEGCLSFPGLTIPVKRFAQVHVKGLNRDGDEVFFESEGLAAVCFQHEIDHLLGIVFLDRLKGLRKRLALRDYAKLVKEAKAGGLRPLA